MKEGGEARNLEGELSCEFGGGWWTSDMARGLPLVSLGGGWE